MLDYGSSKGPKVVARCASSSSSLRYKKLPFNRLHHIVIGVRCLKGEIADGSFGSLHICLSIDVLLVIIHVNVLDYQLIIRAHVLLLIGLVEQAHILKRHIIMLNDLGADCLLLKLLKTLAKCKRLTTVAYDTANKLLFPVEDVLAIDVLKGLKRLEPTVSTAFG